MVNVPNLQYVNGVDLEIDPFSHRAQIQPFTPVITVEIDDTDPTRTITTETVAADPLDVTITLDYF